MFEDWNPKFELLLNLLRRSFVKIPFIAMLMILLYKNINDRTLHNGGMSPHCKQCWENEIAAQMYMLVWLDFFVVVLVTLGLALKQSESISPRTATALELLGWLNLTFPAM